MDTPSNTPEQGETTGPTNWMQAATTSVYTHTFTRSKTYLRVTGPFGIVVVKEITDPAQIEALQQMTTDKETHGDDE